MSKNPKSDPTRLINQWNDQLGKLYKEAEETLFPIYYSLKDTESRYTISTVIGIGGEKIVERVYDLQTGRFVARARPVKKSMECCEHFLREARLLTELQHPNIIPVYDLGLVDKEPFFTMEFIQSGNLKEMLLDQKKIKLEVFLQVCDAIAFAHSKGILNLDIKPENIHAGAFSKVLVLDWGLAQAWREKSLDDVDSLKGTPGFLAPEQLNPNYSLGRFTDVYQLGALLYSIVYKKTPIEGKSIREVLEKTLDGKVDPFDKSKNDNRLNLIIEKAMARSPKARYETVLDLKRDVVRYMGGYATKAEEAGFFMQIRLLYTRHNIICNISFFFSIFIIASIYLFIIQIRESELQAQKDRQKAEDLVYLYDNLNKYKLEMESGVISSIESVLALETDVTKVNKILISPVIKLFNGHNYEAALNYILSVLKYRPTYDSAWMYLGYLHFIKFDFNEAAKAFKNSTNLKTSRNFFDISIKLKDKFDHSNLQSEDIVSILNTSLNDEKWDWVKYHIVCSHYYHRSIGDHLVLLKMILKERNPNARIQIDYSEEDNGPVLSLEGSFGIRSILVFSDEKTVFHSLGLNELHVYGIPRIEGVDLLEKEGVFVIE